MSAKGLRCPSHFAQKQDIWAGFQHVCFVPKNGSGQPKFRGGTINGEFLKFDQDQAPAILHD